MKKMQCEGGGVFKKFADLPSPAFFTGTALICRMPRFHLILHYTIDIPTTSLILYVCRFQIFQVKNQETYMRCHIIKYRTESPLISTAGNVSKTICIFHIFGPETAWKPKSYLHNRQCISHLSISKHYNSNIANRTINHIL